MEGRWILLGFGVVFAVLTLAFLSQANYLQAAIAIVHAIFGLGGFWWATTRDATIETRLPWLD